MKRPWMPFYVADFLADTPHLTATEIGAYMLLISYYWTKGSLPTDERLIQRITRLNNRQWKLSSDVLRSLFIEGWRHRRIDKELNQVIERSEVNSANAKKRHSKSQAVAEAVAVPSDTHSHSHSHSQGKVGGALRAPAPPDEIDDGDIDGYEGMTPTKVLPVEAPPKVKTEPKAKPKPRTKSVQTTWPDGFVLGPDQMEYARRGLTEVEAAKAWTKFRGHHQAKGSKFADWHAAWQNWVRNDVERLGRTMRGEKPAAPAATPAMSLEQWKAILATYARTNNWPLSSPPPGEPGCLVPAELLPPDEPELI